VSGSSPLTPYSGRCPAQAPLPLTRAGARTASRSVGGTGPHAAAPPIRACAGSAPHRTRARHATARAAGTAAARSMTAASEGGPNVGPRMSLLKNERSKQAAVELAGPGVRCVARLWARGVTATRHRCARTGDACAGSWRRAGKACAGSWRRACKARPAVGRPDTAAPDTAGPGRQARWHAGRLQQH
jgi:hypothetical protein